MWHEARRQERKIRGMLVDYRRRAERRRDFYEKIKADPTQFLQIHGRQCKIHLDANIAAAADTAVMMPWQGHADNLIDRFDVRAHLDLIPNIDKAEEEKLTQDERHLNYERYRIIAQNAFLSVPEEKFLKQLHLEEQFGYTEYKTKKDVRTGGAAIGFNYEDSTGIPQESPVEITSEEENSDSDLDVDLAINVSKMDPTQANEMNKHGRSYGMSSNDFYSFLINDLEEAEAVKQAREEEQEKALFSGRKSRRERRYHREKRLANRTISPPSYAAKASPTLLDFHESKSLSRTPSPENSGKITYITSFGEDEETPSTSKPTFASKVKFGKPKPKLSNEKVTVTSSANRRHSRSKSRSNDGYYNKSSRSKNITSKKSKRSRTRSKSRSRRSRSNSRSGYRRQRSRSSSSRSRSYSRSLSTNRRSSSRSRDRSRGYRRRHSSTSSSSSSKSSSRSSSSDSSRRKSPKKKTPEKSKVDHIPSTQESGTEIIQRYYGRRKNDKSSSDLSDLNDDDDKPSYDSNGGESQKDTNLLVTKKTTTSMTIIERLKRKRQALLNRQFKADKIAEQAKTEREKLEQQTREDELREMAIKLRKRQREKRHANDSVSSSNSDDSSRSYDSNYSKERSRSRSREKDSRRHHRRTRRNSDDRRSTSRERRRRDRKDRERERDRRGRRSSSPSRGSKDRYRDDREVRLVNY